MRAERRAVTDHILAFAARYPADIFPTATDGGGITGNAGAAARHVLTVLADDINSGEHTRDDD